MMTFHEIICCFVDNFPVIMDNKMAAELGDQLRQHVGIQSP